MKNELAALVEKLNAEEPRALPDFATDTQGMLDKALEHATSVMVGVRDAELLPLWAMATANGQIVVVATPFGDAASKDLIATALRKFMREANVVRYSFTSEAWLATPSKESWEAGDRRPPSEREDRVEVVMSIAADRGGEAMETYRIERDATGLITALSVWKDSEGMTALNGRFSNMLE